MNETLVNLASVCLPVLCILLTVAGFYVADLISEQTEEIQQRTDNETAAHIIGIAGEAIAQAVAFTAQTYADELKKAGSFDADAQKQAFEMAKAKALEILGPAVLKSLDEIYGDADTWIDTKIEQACREVKQQTGAAN